MSRRTEEILERYRSAQSLDEANRARLFGAIQDRLASGAGLPKPGNAHAPGTASSLAKTASIVPKIIVGLVLAGAPAAWLARGTLLHPAPAVVASLPTMAPESARMSARAPVPESEWTPASAPALGPALTPPLGPASALGPALAPLLGPACDSAESLPPGRALAAHRLSHSPYKAAHEAASHAAPDQGLAELPGDTTPDTAGAALAPSAVATRSTTASAVVPAPAPVPTSAPVPPPTRVPAAIHATVPEVPAAPAPSLALGSPGGNAVDEEVRLVGLAYSLLHDGAPAKALVVLDEHERRFPNGRLAESRRVTRILALCQDGRQADARAERDRFLALYPRSPFTTRVQAACGAAR